MAITTDHVVFFLCPFVIDPEKAAQGGPRFDWEPERGTRIAVVRRDGSGETRWFSTEPFFMFHFMNAYETGGGIACEYCQFAALPVAVFNLPTPPALWRMTLDFKTDGAMRERLDERPGEFPRVDPRMWGRPYRHGWLPVATQEKRAPGTWTGLARYDFKTGEIAIHDFGPGHEIDEPVFVPRSSSAEEGDGWVMTYVYDAASDRSTFVILDARESERAPIAEILLPRRVPHGFHGDWMPAV